MSFYKNVQSQQDSELYNLSQRLSLTLVKRISEDCQRKNIKTIAFRMAYYNSEQDEEYSHNRLQSIGSGLPDEIRNRDINILGYDFMEKMSEIFTDYIYKKYLGFILDYKKKTEKNKPLSPLILNIHVEMIGYTQEYYDYVEYYMRTRNIGLNTDYTEVRSQPPLERLSIYLQGTYLNMNISESSFSHMSGVSSSTRFDNNYVYDSKIL